MKEYDLQEVQRAERWDCVVVGAGLAGTSAAIGLARDGIRVLLVDRARFPRHKVCGGCLNQRALAVLADLGLREALERLRPIALSSLELASGARRMRLPLPEGRGIARATLDQMMVDAFVSAGGTFRDATTASLGPASRYTRTLTLTTDDDTTWAEAQLILAADGLNGSLMRNAGAPQAVSPQARVGAGTVFSCEDGHFEPGVIHMAVAREGYVGATVVEDGQIDMAAAFDTGFLRQVGSPAAAAQHVLRDAGYPAHEALLTARWKGTPPLTRRAPTLGQDRVLVIGDAAGYVEPFTGEGMAWALTSGRAVVPHALKGLEGFNPGVIRGWERAHESQVVSRQFLCRTIARILRSPRSVRGALALLQLQPRLATPLMRYVNASSS